MCVEEEKKVEEASYKLQVTTTSTSTYFFSHYEGAKMLSRYIYIRPQAGESGVKKLN